MRFQIAGMVAAAALAISPVAAASVSGDAVKIGILTDTAGVYSTMTGNGSIVAAQMAVEDFGGKVLGKPVEVLSADHQNKPDIASSIARQWMDRDGVDMLADMVTSSVAISVQKLASSKGVITMTTSAGSTALTNEECTPLGIHYVYDTYALPSGTGAAVVENGGKKWFFITADYAFGHSLEANTTRMIKELGGQVVGSVRHPLGTNDFSSYLLQAQSSGADVIALANAGTDFTNALRQAAEFGVTKSNQVVGMLVYLTDVKALGLPASQGLQFTLAWYWDQNDEARGFANRFKQRHGAMPTSVQAGLYSAVTSYLKAVEAAGTDEGAAVRAQLGRMTMNDMFHRNATVRPDGRVMHDMYLMQAKKPSESKGEWDLLEVAGTIPADKAFIPLSESKCPLARK
jgi:branched-chain amino acid transport system substrate-binding protein